MLTMVGGIGENGRAVESGEDELLSAGSRAPAGRYVRADVAWKRVLILDRDDWLPASLDGRVALYRRLPTETALHGARPMIPELAVVLLVATVAAMASSLALLLTLDPQVEEVWGASERVEDPERDSLDWEWRLRTASLPEAYWY